MIGVWVLVITINGQSADFPNHYRMNSPCEEHRKLIERALKQAGSNAIVRCEWKDKQ